MCGAMVVVKWSASTLMIWVWNTLMKPLVFSVKCCLQRTGPFLLSPLHDRFWLGIYQGLIKRWLTWTICSRTTASWRSSTWKMQHSHSPLVDTRFSSCGLHCLVNLPLRSMCNNTHVGVMHNPGKDRILIKLYQMNLKYCKRQKILRKWQYFAKSGHTAHDRNLRSVLSEEFPKILC